MYKTRPRLKISGKTKSLCVFFYWDEKELLMKKIFWIFAWFFFKLHIQIMMRRRQDWVKLEQMRQDRDETKSKILYDTETGPRVLVPLVSEPRLDRNSHPLLVHPSPPSFVVFWPTLKSCSMVALSARIYESFVYCPLVLTQASICRCFIVALCARIFESFMYNFLRWARLLFEVAR